MSHTLPAPNSLPEKTAAVKSSHPEGEDSGDSEPSGSSSKDRLNSTLSSPNTDFFTHQSSSTEIGLISQLWTLFSPTSSTHVPVDYSDDCAQLLSSKNETLLMSTDAICEGVHFDLEWDSLFDVGAQAAVVNLSDLAASGAAPKALLWSLSMPPSMDSKELMELARGFQEVAHEAKAPVIGGNILTREGGLEIHVTAIGASYHTPITRKGALPGDLIYVTGVLGERALGYLYPSKETRRLRHQWRPHTQESKLLSQWGEVTAMLDISDGLLLDACRLGKESQVEIHLNSTSIPLGEHLKDRPSLLDAALSGGEDYVLLFTAPAHVSPPCSVNTTLIGQCKTLDQENASGHVIFLDGLPQKPLGFLHTINKSDS